MNKKVFFSSENQLKTVQKIIVEQMDTAIDDINHICKIYDKRQVLRMLRFHKRVHDNVFDEDMNFIEYINQTFTYLVCIYAGRYFFEKGLVNEIEINFGTQSGFDILADNGKLICECFSVTNVKSNSKLRKEAQRVHNTEAEKKFIFYYSEAANTEYTYVEKVQVDFPDVEIVNITFENLINY